MQSTKNKVIGLVAMFSGMALCVFFLWLFNFNGVIIDFTSGTVLLESLAPVISVICGLYLGIYFYSGKKLAAQVGGGMALLAVVGYLLGFMRHLIR